MRICVNMNMLAVRLSLYNDKAALNWSHMDQVGGVGLVNNLPKQPPHCPPLHLSTSSPLHYTCIPPHGGRARPRRPPSLHFPLSIHMFIVI